MTADLAELRPGRPRARPAGGRGPAAPSPPRRRHVVLALGPWSLRVERRVLGVGVVLAVLVAVAMAASTLFGDYGLAVRDVLAILGGDESDPRATYFVTEQRIPRVLAGAAVGAALALSGAIFQNLSRNPLGSPDIIGFTVGAASGALAQIILFDAAPDAVAAGAVVGGLGTAVAVYALSWQRGVAAHRLVLVGVGVGAVLQALNALLVVKASLTEAQTAAVWLAGSLNAMTWGPLLRLSAALAVLVPAALALARPLGSLVLGDDVAAATGVRVERCRLGLVAVGVALVAAAVATAGPLAFVALAAPQIGRRLTRTPWAGPVVSALVGALVVVLSDLVAQRIFAPTQLPVGVVTGSLGGAYLIWLLAWQRRNPLL